MDCDNHSCLFLSSSECLDGEVTCFEEYIPDMNDELTPEQVEQLKDELVQLFYYQYNHERHIRTDIRVIHRNPTMSKYKPH